MELDVARTRALFPSLNSGAARAAIGDLLGVDPGGVVFGRSMTALTFELARTLARARVVGG